MFTLGGEEEKPQISQIKKKRVYPQISQITQISIYNLRNLRNLRMILL
ncbi:protein of unknown function [Candidatus Promineifilum breve]|uniref:Uncharacterized protein n=1 Tax=Candidatus Promineifilum breve TaxID=1806508 RepID=A0A161KAU8_9CHLR|nr:protein of unknown function [Candidatus Promineifilum breve]